MRANEIIGIYRGAIKCLERNEKNGVVYHREGVNGDYDNFNDVEKLIKFIKLGHG